MNKALLSTVLCNLERSDFILRYSQFGNKSKGAIYRLVDFYTLFYYRFIDGFNAQDEEWWSHNLQSPAIESWQGLSFELLCLLHLAQVKQKLGISGIATAASSWRYIPPKKNEKEERKEKGTQIDLLIDRGDRVINLCEMKFSVKLYYISENYEKTLRDRMSIFQEKTKTSKSLVYTFVTTFGIANSVGRSIVNSEVTMDDLFAK